MLNFISIKDLTHSTEEYPRSVSLIIGDDPNKMKLLGNLEHGSDLSVDEPNARLLIEALLKVYPETLHSNLSPMYVYIKSDPGLWTVGFYEPDGTWVSDSDYDSPEAAAERVHYLNGGN